MDLVVVATPNQSHIPLGLRAFESGLPVVVDKPLAATVADGRRLVERAREAGVMVTGFQNRRWDSDFLTLRRLVAQGRLGRIHRYEARSSAGFLSFGRAAGARIQTQRRPAASSTTSALT